MRAVDTNVLVRLLTRDDAKQAAAADAFVQNGAWVPQLALAEAIWVLDTVYERTKSDITTSVEMLLEHNQLVIEGADVVAAALSVFRARPALGFSDCLMLEVARKAGHLPLGTFDKDLSKADGAERIV
ncbi:MAG: PIN domain-containing protein [Vicinamibacterales bacterium]